MKLCPAAKFSPGWMATLIQTFMDCHRFNANAYRFHHFKSSLIEVRTYLDRLKSTNIATRIERIVNRLKSKYENNSKLQFIRCRCLTAPNSQTHRPTCLIVKVIWRNTGFQSGMSRRTGVTFVATQSWQIRILCEGENVHPVVRRARQWKRFKREGSCVVIAVNNQYIVNATRY